MGVRQGETFSQLSLPPGFRFYPTDEELMVQYLCRKIAGYDFPLPIIGDIDLYKYDPWDLPGKALFGEKEWYFFSPRDRKYPNGSRPNRVAGSGYWKATGTDKIIISEGRKVGVKKALVFYVGKAPKGTKTNWIMHEYRLFESPQKNGSARLDDWVLCRIYKKSCSAEKAAARISGVQSKEHTHSSPSSSSSQYDDVLPEIEGGFFPTVRGTNEVPKIEMGFEWGDLGDLGPFSEMGQTQRSIAHLLGPNPSAFEPYSVRHFAADLRVPGQGAFQQNGGMFPQDPPGSIDPLCDRYVPNSSGFGYIP